MLPMKLVLANRLVRERRYDRLAAPPFQPLRIAANFGLGFFVTALIAALVALGAVALFAGDSAQIALA